MKQDSQMVTLPWSQSVERLLAELNVDVGSGLASTEARRRLKKYGPNRLRRVKPKSLWHILAEQFKSLMLLLLAAAAVLAFVLADREDGIAILVVIALNVIIGFIVELRGVRSMEALYRLVQVNVRTRRDGRVQEIRADRLVPGDIVVLEGGDMISADLRLIEAANLQADESTLTGESVPVNKSAKVVDAEAALAKRRCMLYSGTAVTRGSGEGLVIATGLATELGRISSLVAETKEEVTPLERRLEVLGRRLIWVTLGLTALLAAAGMALGRDIMIMLEIAIALAVAAVPEGLPVVATIALARGMWRMAQQNALISRLSAVETLGATGVICTDKTGTLTENRMTVIRLLLASGEEIKVGRGGQAAFSINGKLVNPEHHALLRCALETAVLCNNASLDLYDAKVGIGDPLEIALLSVGRKAGLTHESLLKNWPETREEAFNTDTKMMATFHKVGDAYREAVKGAPEAVLAACNRIQRGELSEPMTIEAREHWAAENTRLADAGLRMLALACRRLTSNEGKAYEDLVFLGLVGLLDPPRQDVAAAIKECRGAGIRVVMVTGDQPSTARYVSEQVGLVNDCDVRIVHGQALKPLEEMTEEVRDQLLKANIFARVDPAQKLDLIALHQANGMVVAMTGDGVNDAPALKKADIGVAMGQHGTQVAREAADMVLKDDAFNSIVLAVHQGRIIFDNIRKFVLYLLSCNVSEVMVVAFATLANAPLPLLPLQILFLNLVTDVFPALALGVGSGDARIMARPPRPEKEAILTRWHWLAIAGYGTLITVAVFSAFALALFWLDMAIGTAVTVSFLTLAFAQLWHVFNMRSRDSSFFFNDITRNGYVWGALVLCAALILLAVYLPALAQVLRLEALEANGWTLVLVASLMPLLVGQLLKLVTREK